MASRRSAAPGASQAPPAPISEADARAAILAAERLTNERFTEEYHQLCVKHRRQFVPTLILRGGAAPEAQLDIAHWDP